MFKIDTSANPKQQLKAYNTRFTSNDDTMFNTHIVPTYDCNELEKILQIALAKYKCQDEWFKLPHAQLNNIVNTFMPIKNVIDSNPIFQCAKCTKVYLSNASFEKHRTQCMEQFKDFPFKCSECSIQFTTQRKYNNHITGGCKYKVPCPNCKSIFRGKLLLDRHLQHSVCR